MNLPIGLALEPLAIGRVVSNGDGILTHSVPNTTQADEIADATLQWEIGEPVAAAGMLLMEDGTTDGGFPRAMLYRTVPS